MTNCGRCYALKNKIKKGYIEVIGPNNTQDHLCKECFEELDLETLVIDENKKN